MNNRKLRIKAQEIWEARANWYQWHLAHRNYVAALPLEVRRIYHAIASQQPEPILTVFGGFPHDWPPAGAYELAAHHHLNAAYACTWYTTPAGWDIFQALWHALPEPADFLREPSTLITGRP